MNCATNTRTFIAAAEKSSSPPQVSVIVNWLCCFTKQHKSLSLGKYLNYKPRRKQRAVAHSCLKSRHRVGKRDADPDLKSRKRCITTNSVNNVHGHVGWTPTNPQQISATSRFVSSADWLRETSAAHGSIKCLLPLPGTGNAYSSSARSSHFWSALPWVTRTKKKNKAIYSPVSARLINPLQQMPYTSVRSRSNGNLWL